MALHRVTDDFIAHLAALGDDADLEETTEFLVVAATLLDLKAARLLPGAEVEDEEDLALLEARDLLFARLLQYRAYKQVAALFRELEAAARLRGTRARCRCERSSRRCCRRCSWASTPPGSPSSRPRCSGPRRRRPWALDHLHAPERLGARAGGDPGRAARRRPAG